MYEPIQISNHNLQEIVYFILMKFKADELHLQGTSQKRDLLGGYIERWFNKASEKIIFDHLLKDKSYKVITDYFIYDNSTPKNAPDIIGLKHSEKIIPFVLFNDGVWEEVEGMPRIEIKTIRNNQALFGVREAQLTDDFYVFIESDIHEDMIATLFDDSLFNPGLLEGLKTYSEFIKSDKYNQLIQNIDVTKPKDVGTFRLLGVFTKDDLLKITTKCPKGDNPWYLAKVENVTKALSPKKKPTKLKIDNELLARPNVKDVYIPVHITSKNGGIVQVELLSEFMSSIYLKTDQALIVNGKEVLPGIIKISFKQFERSSSWVEYLCTKDIIQSLQKDSSALLIDELDKIIEKQVR